MIPGWLLARFRAPAPVGLAANRNARSRMTEHASPIAPATFPAYVVDVVERVNAALDAWEGFGPDSPLTAISNEDWYWYLQAADSRADASSLSLIAAELAGRLHPAKTPA